MAQRRLCEINLDTAMVRALLDEVERATDASTKAALTEQLLEELSRLGSCLLETARMIVAPDSGIRLAAELRT